MDDDDDDDGDDADGGAWRGRKMVGGELVCVVVQWGVCVEGEMVLLVVVAALVAARALAYLIYEGCVCVCVCV